MGIEHAAYADGGNGIALEIQLRHKAGAAVEGDRLGGIRLQGENARTVHYLTGQRATEGNHADKGLVGGDLHVGDELILHAEDVEAQDEGNAFLALPGVLARLGGVIATFVGFILFLGLRGGRGIVVGCAGTCGKKQYEQEKEGE